MSIEQANRKLWDAAGDEQLSTQERIQGIRAAVDDGADLDMIESYKYPTPLIWAALQGDEALDVLRELVSLGATLNLDLSEECPNRAYNNAFEAALSQGQFEAASLLIDLGSDVNMNKYNFAEAISGGWDSPIELVVAKKMFDAGAYCDPEFVAKLREGNNSCYLCFTDNYWEEDSPRTYDIVEGWIKEREAMARAEHLDAVLPKTVVQASNDWHPGMTVTAIEGPMGSEAGEQQIQTRSRSQGLRL